jgi:hypothetical protein
MTEDKCRVPAYLVQMGDDGSFGGFTLLWYKLRPKADDAPITTMHIIRKTFHGLPLQYVRNFNGALIFHGFDTAPGGPPSFAVSLSSSPWSVHT